jgi:APA family basic amino acid/polyamine antiporter
MSEVAGTPSPKLVRELGVVDAAMIVVGSMIGSGIFITSAESSRLVGAPGWLLMAWALAGVLTITGAMCCAELATMMPWAGGQYVFLRAAYGPAVGFLFGWSTFLVVQTGTIAAVAVAFAKFLGLLVPWVSNDPKTALIPPLGLGRFAISLTTQQLIAITVIASLTAVNTLGLKTGKFIQNLFTFTKTAALIGLIVVGLAFGINRDAAAWTAAWWNPWANGWSPQQAQPGLSVAGALALVLLLGKAMVGPLFSQTAWNSVTFTGGEVRDPDRTLPRALILGCGGVVLLYLMANVVYVTTLSLDQIQHAPENRVGTAAMQAVLGDRAAWIMAAFILISTFGCDNGLVLSGARVYYAMARDGLFFSRIGTVNRRHVPAAALVAQGVWACLLILPRTVTTDPSGANPTYGDVYNELLEYVVAADLSFYTLMVGAVLIMRRKAPKAPRPFRTPGYPLPAVLYLTLAISLLLDLISLAPGTSGKGFAIVLAGIPVYFLWRAFGTPKPSADVA